MAKNNPRAALKGQSKTLNASVAAHRVINIKGKSNTRLHPRNIGRANTVFTLANRASRYKFQKRNRVQKVVEKREVEKKVEEENPINWKAYEKAWEARMKAGRIWVMIKKQEDRLNSQETKELMAFFGKSKFGGRPELSSLSKYAKQALKMWEIAAGTDLEWAKGQTAVWGSWAGYVEQRFGAEMVEYGPAGQGDVGSIGETDLESKFTVKEGDDEGEEEYEKCPGKEFGKEGT